MLLELSDLATAAKITARDSLTEPLSQSDGGSSNREDNSLEESVLSGISLSVSSRSPSRLSYSALGAGPVEARARLAVRGVQQPDLEPILFRSGAGPGSQMLSGSSHAQNEPTIGDDGHHLRPAAHLSVLVFPRFVPATGLTSPPGCAVRQVPHALLAWQRASIAALSPFWHTTELLDVAIQALDVTKAEEEDEPNWHLKQKACQGWQKSSDMPGAAAAHSGPQSSTCSSICTVWHAIMSGRTAGRNA